MISTYKGRPIEELTREELLEAINEIALSYDNRLAIKDKAIEYFKAACDIFKSEIKEKDENYLSPRNTSGYRPRPG